MKRTHNLTILGFSAISILLASCSSVKQNNVFLKRKYFDFKKHSHAIVKNEPIPIASPKDEETTDRNTTGQSISKNGVQTATPFLPISVGIAVLKSRTFTERREFPKVQINPATIPLSNSNRVDKGLSKVNQQFFPEHDDHSSNGGDISTNELILIILAILISPLAVYLYEKAVTNHFWLDLVLWVIGVAILPFFYFSGLCLLAAIIYAILIVTGNIK